VEWAAFHTLRHTVASRMFGRGPQRGANAALARPPLPGFHDGPLCASVERRPRRPARTGHASRRSRIVVSSRVRGGRFCQLDLVWPLAGLGAGLTILALVARSGSDPWLVRPAVARLRLGFQALTTPAVVRLPESMCDAGVAELQAEVMADLIPGATLSPHGRCLGRIPLERLCRLPRIEGIGRIQKCVRLILQSLDLLM
jgi:hypothetical protein